ncbi:MAG: hypothetical protein EB127_32110, partial [Alphaproteobacteria bacterium]|nr:hypothetical protein [Alphaproteobacteria bacterium]
LEVTDALPIIFVLPPIVAVAPTEIDPVSEMLSALIVLKRIPMLPRFEEILALGKMSDPKKICPTLARVVATSLDIFTDPVHLTGLGYDLLVRDICNLSLQ